MKKILSLLLVLILGLTAFGCSKETASQKTKEELRAEIKAEMEAEAKLKEELKAEIQAEEKAKEKEKAETTTQATTQTKDNDNVQQPNAEALAPLDVRNNDKLYEFINTTYPDKYTREDFDKWTAFYFDITKDGNDEVGFTTTYFDGKLEYAIFITVDNGQYKVIPSEIELSKYQNDLAYNEGFITIAQKAGGSGMFLYVTSYFIYDGDEIRDTDASIVTEDVVAMPTGYSIKGEIDGDIRNFVYTATKEDYATEKTFVIEKTKYVYNPETMKFEKEILIGEKKNGEGSCEVDTNNNQKSMQKTNESTTQENDNKNTQEKNDYTKGVECEARNGNVYIKYKNTGNEVEVFNPNTTTIHKDDGNGVFTFKSGKVKGAIARTTSLGNNGSRLYFTTNEYEEYVRNAYSTFYVDMATLNVYFVANGEYIKHVTDYPYSNYTIVANDQDGSIIYSAYDNSNQFSCYLGGSLDSDIVAQIASAMEAANSDAGSYGVSGFNTETIAGEEIDYSKYMAVVVPMHSTSNIDSLTRETCSFSDNPDNQKVSFAIFGEMKDIKVTYFESMDSQGEVETVKDLKNSYLDIYAAFSTDMSYIKVTGKVHTGEGNYSDVEFTMDNMRDVSEYEVLKFK